ncbi:MAG: AraC family transcriptional regulator [Bacteroidota bacterium]
MNSASLGFAHQQENRPQSHTQVNSEFVHLARPDESFARSGEGIFIHYALKGKQSYRLHFRKYLLEPGQFVLGTEAAQPMGESKIDASVLQVFIPFSVFAKAHAGEENDLNLRLKNGEWDLYEGAFQAVNDPLALFLQDLSDELSRPHANDQQRELGLQIAKKILASQQNIFEQINKLTSAKRSTKKELYRRLCLAQEYIHEHLHTALDLDTLAQVACLSKFHFIRLFKEVFGSTPRQYLIALRLDRASKLLVSSKKSFHEICLEVGLKDSSSFGRLFKKNFGATPHIYRRMYVQA